MNNDISKLKQRLQRIDEGDFSHMAASAEMDNEVQLARSDLYQLAEYSMKLRGLLNEITEQEGLDGWMQEKITLANDYISQVFHALEFDPRVTNDIRPEQDELELDVEFSEPDVSTELSTEVLPATVADIPKLSSDLDSKFLDWNL